MNPTTINIKTALEDTNFINDLNTLLSKASSYKHGESTVGERVTYLQSNVTVIQNAIEEGIVDQLPETRRKSIWTAVNNIKNNLANARRYTFNSTNPQARNFINQVIINTNNLQDYLDQSNLCLLYTSPSPRDRQKSRMPSSA